MILRALNSERDRRPPGSNERKTLEPLKSSTERSDATIRFVQRSTDERSPPWPVSYARCKNAIRLPLTVLR